MTDDFPKRLTAELQSEAKIYAGAMLGDIFLGIANAVERAASKPKPEPAKQGREWLQSVIDAARRDAQDIPPEIRAHSPGARYEASKLQRDQIVMVTAADLDDVARKARREALEEAEMALRKRADDLARAGKRDEALTWIEAAGAIAGVAQP